MQRKTVVGILQTACLLGVLTCNLRAADPLDIWQWRNPLPQGNKLVAINFCGGRLIAVGNQGAIVSSPALTSQGWTNSGWASPNAWTNSGWFVGSSGTNLSLTCVAYGNNNWVVGAAAGNVLTSPDGTNWTVHATSITKDLAGIAYSADYGFVAVAASGNILASPDGTNWTARTSGTSKDLAAITYRPGFGFVAVGAQAGTGLNSLILTSPDGNNPWTIQNSATTIGLNGITYGTNSSGDGIFVVSGSSGLILTSPDGTNWIGQSSGITASLKSVAYGAGVGFAAVGSSSSISWVTASPDGTNWTSGLAVPGNEGLAGVAYAPGMFVAVGYYGMVESSPDGHPNNWVAQSLYITYDDAYYNAGAWNGTNFVVVGTGGAAVTSPDGVTWTNRAPTSAGTTSFRGIGFGRDTFVAVGDSGLIVTSTDNGTNWSPQASPLANKLKSVAYGGDSFVATGDAGVVVTSPDATNWTYQASGTGSSLSVVYGAGTFVAVGASGVIMTSVDNGTNWAAQSSGQTTDLNGVAYGANTFVAVGARNKVLSSPDGTNWTLQTTAGGSSSPTFNGVAYGSGVFVVAGSGTSPVLSSADGINWKTNADVNGISQRFVAYGANSFVIGGSGGILLQASASRPRIVFDHANGGLTLTWSGGGTLQASPVVTGPYTNVPWALSPYVVPSLAEPSRFFRVQLP